MEKWIQDVDGNWTENEYPIYFGEHGDCYTSEADFYAAESEFAAWRDSLTA